METKAESLLSQSKDKETNADSNRNLKSHSVITDTSRSSPWRRRCNLNMMRHKLSIISSG